MNRRRFLRTAGTLGGVGSLVGLAVCGRLSGGGADAGRADACGPYEPTVTGSPG